MISSLGFTKGSISEVLVTTCNRDGSPNTAPMGVLSDGESRLYLRVAEDTDTFRNIGREGYFTVNLTHDPLLFLQAALRGRKRGGRVVEVENVGMGKRTPFLKDASACLEVKAEEVRGYRKKDSLGESAFKIVGGRVVRVEVLHELPRAVNRGLCAVIEMAVELSRGKEEELGAYLEMARKCLPSSEYRAICSFLRELQD